MISIPHVSGGTLAGALKLRDDASQILGIDVGLVLGPPVGIEGAAARRAREDALADMTATGFISPAGACTRSRAAIEQLRELADLEAAAGLTDPDLGAVA
ncbi:hypothetical protein ID875_21475 [Streptomyces globisporus]|uniref:Uncharacterized protein n=1 Tax=Streptomyces globisporus TaxID=1908 RepID=A0A927BLJ2_STRGL|nr:hypothetical protein [Streptomyces globisporus]